MRSKHHTSARRLLLLALGSAAASPLLPASELDAQVIRMPGRSREPAFWGSVGAGYVQMGGLLDGRTNSVWNFSDGFQYRASLEYALGGGLGVGVAGAHARLPLTYSQRAITPGGPGIGTVEAHADVRSLQATVHAGGGLGFHQVIQVGVGVTQFTNFQRDDSDERIGPTGDTDLSFGLGYGFGYTLGPRLSISIVQDYAYIIHQRDGLSNDERRSVNQYTTRLGLRAGFGYKRTRI